MFTVASDGRLVWTTAADAMAFIQATGSTLVTSRDPEWTLDVSLWQREGWQYMLHESAGAGGYVFEVGGRGTGTIENFAMSGIDVAGYPSNAATFIENRTSPITIGASTGTIGASTGAGGFSLGGLLPILIIGGALLLLSH